MRYLIEGVNPEPWTSPEVSFRWVNRKPHPVVFKREQLKVYQEALKEEFARLYPDAEMLEGDIDLTFYFWRQVAHGHGRDRAQNANYADATNLQKATEDALQEVLYPNDRAVRRVRSEMVQQGPEVEPRILILVSDYFASFTSDLNDLIKEAISPLASVASTRRSAMVDDDDLF